MADIIDPVNAAEAAKHINGATIAWGAGRYYDFETPNPEVITIEDAAFALAYTVRWRGQGRNFKSGARAFYGVAEHCVRGAEHMIDDGHGYANALAFLFHEPDEIVLPDMPGPVKPCLPGWREFANKQGNAALARFNIHVPDPALLKRYDIRMLVTERRDLLGDPDGYIWTNGGGGGTISTVGFEPFAERIVPYWHPDTAAHRFIELYDALCIELGREA